jgi:hypothetical protein
VDPALLAETSPKIDPDAPAEAVFRRIKVDDSDYPEGRILSEYNRYKIYAPEKATAVTRIAQQEVTVDGSRVSGHLEIRATFHRAGRSRAKLAATPHFRNR